MLRQSIIPCPWFTFTVIDATNIHWFFNRFHEAAMSFKYYAYTWTVGVNHSGVNRSIDIFDETAFCVRRYTDFMVFSSGYENVSRQTFYDYHKLRLN